MNKNISENHFVILNVEVEIETKQVISKTSVLLYEEYLRKPSKFTNSVFLKEGNSLRKGARTTKKENRLDYVTAVRVSTFLSLILAVAARRFGYVPKDIEILCKREAAGISQNVGPICQMTRRSIQEVCYLQNR